jgi:hypothetical protein
MYAPPAFRSSMTAMLALFPLLLAGCSGGMEDNRAGLACVDDSKDCVDKRQATLNHMLADKEKSWVKEPATPHAHASGVRLFAYRTQKKDLSCDELAAGRREADGAAKVLRGPDAKGLSPAQVSRAMMFATEVSKELTAEMRNRRCKA